MSKQLIGICLALAITGCTRFTLLNTLSPQLGVCRTTGIAYGPLPRQKLDVYSPSHPVKGPLTVVIFFYGGEWAAGQRNDYQFAGEALASRGFLAVVPDYRLYPEVTFPKFVDDAALATRWVHDHIADRGGNVNRIFVMGHSAGAHIAALLTLDPSYLNGVGLDPKIFKGFIGISGPYDFVPYAEDRGTFNMRPGQKLPDPAIEPVHFAKNPADVALAPPMLLMQGETDTVVEPYNATHLADAVNRSGGDAKIYFYRHQGHEQMVIAFATFFRGLAPVLDNAAAFIRTH